MLLHELNLPTVSVSVSVFSLCFCVSACVCECVFVWGPGDAFIIRKFLCLGSEVRPLGLYTNHGCREGVGIVGGEGGGVEHHNKMFVLFLFWFFVFCFHRQFVKGS